MKRIIALFLTVCLIIPQFTITGLAAADTKAPEIGEVTLTDPLGTVYGYGDTVGLVIKATDDGQLNYATVSIVSTGSSADEVRDLQIAGNPSADGFYGGLKISDDYGQVLGTGTYTITKVTVYDMAGNYAEKELDSPGLSFEVKNDPTESGKIKVKDISLMPKEGSSTGTEFTYQVTLDTSGAPDVEIESMSISLEPVAGHSHGMPLELSEDGVTYKRSFIAEEEFEVYRNRIVFKQVEIYDTKGGVYFYAPEDSSDIDGYTCWGIKGVKTGDLDVVLTDVAEDLDAPELVSYSYGKSVLYTPDYQTIEVKAKDATTTPYMVEALLKRVGDEEGIEDVTLLGYYDESAGKMSTAVMEHNYPRYVDNAEYYISSMIIRDSSGNEKSYSIDDGTLKKKTYKVVNNNKADLFTSTTDPELLSKVQNAEAGATVVVNIDQAKTIVPKAVFDSIKGRDVTLIFEKMYDLEQGSDSSDEGMQWIMNGKDFNKATKDIDVYFYMEQAWDDSWVKAHEKRLGKPFPPMSGSGSGDDLDLSREIKESLKAGGWGDVIPEIEAMRKPKEEFCDAFFRISGKEYVRFVFADNGELPGKTTIRMKPSYAMHMWMPDKNLKLYYKNPHSGKFQLKQKGINKHAEGYFEFDIYHNSEYALADELYNVEGVDAGTGSDGNPSDNNKKSPDTGDTTDWKLPALMALLSIMGICGTLIRRPNTNE